jgi:nucleotide-binding universal stress UspA family protein
VPMWVGRTRRALRRPPSLVLGRASSCRHEVRRFRRASLQSDDPVESGLVVLAYDGSDLAKAAIEEAGQQLGAGRPGLVLTVWEPLDVNAFFPVGRTPIPPTVIESITKAAEDTAAEGASLARAAGFSAESMATDGAPIWKRIVDVADERDASLIVLGSHGRTGLAGVLIGSVAGGVAQHSRRSVLIVHRPR